MWKDSHATSMPSTSGVKASYVAEIPRRLAFLAIQGLWTKHCLENKSPGLVCHLCTLLTGDCTFGVIPSDRKKSTYNAQVFSKALWR